MLSSCSLQWVVHLHMLQYMVEWPLISSFTVHYWIIGVHSVVSFNSHPRLAPRPLLALRHLYRGSRYGIFILCMHLSIKVKWLSSVCWYINQWWPTWVLVVTRNCRTLLKLSLSLRNWYWISILVLTVGWHDTFQIGTSAVEHISSAHPPLFTLVTAQDWTEMQ